MRTKFHELDEALDALRSVTERYDLVVYGKQTNFMDEMLLRKLPTSWDHIFLKPWATEETVALRLGEMEPPMEGPRRPGWCAPEY